MLKAKVKLVGKVFQIDITESADAENTRYTLKQALDLMVEQETLVEFLGKLRQAVAETDFAAGAEVSVG